MKHTKASLILDSTRDDYGQFRTGWKVYKGRKYYWFDYLTNISGYRDKTFRMPIERVNAYPSVETFIASTDWDNEQPVWTGEPIF